MADYSDFHSGNQRRNTGSRYSSVRSDGSKSTLLFLLLALALFAVFSMMMCEAESPDGGVPLPFSAEIPEPLEIPDFPELPALPEMPEELREALKESLRP